MNLDSSALAQRLKIIADDWKDELDDIGNLINQNLNSLPKEGNYVLFAQSFINILSSKTYASSNIDDIEWFYNNGMSRCRNILDFGCGIGYITSLISNCNNKVTGLEYDGKAYGQQYGPKVHTAVFHFVQNILKKKKPALKFEFYKKLPLIFPNNSFDGILMYGVIEHFSDNIKIATLKEITRILKPGGYLFIGKLPRALSYQEHLARVLKIDSHDVLYSKKMILNLLKANGLEVNNIESTGMFFNSPPPFTNRFFHITSPLERLIDKFFSVLKIISHDYRVVAVKKPR